MPEARLELYGTGWCPKSAVLRNHLQHEWIDFDDYNVEEDAEAAARVRSLYQGQLKFPTVVFGADFLKNPSVPELDAFLRRYGLT